MVRFSYLGQNIFKLLDEEGIAKCRKVGKAWCAFKIKPGSVVPHYRQGDCNSDCPGEGILTKISVS